MRDDLEARLSSILEGATVTQSVGIGNDNDGEHEEFTEDQVDPEMIAETTIALLMQEAEIFAMDIVKDFITENAHKLIRDQLLTENAASQSYVVLDRDSRRKKAENLLKLQMAKKAGDPRYIKLVALRRTWRRLRDQIRNDPRYASAHTVIMKRQFRTIPNAQAMAARRNAQQTRLT